MQRLDRQADVVLLRERNDRGDAVGDLLSRFFERLARHRAADQDNQRRAEFRRLADGEAIILDRHLTTVFCRRCEEAPAAERHDRQSVLTNPFADPCDRAPFERLSPNGDPTDPGLGVFLNRHLDRPGLGRHRVNAELGTIA